MKQLLPVFLLILLRIPLYGQHIIARQIPFFHQLPSNEIWDVGQDKDGYLWVSTTNGIARYDGYKLQFFRSDYKLPDLLTNNSIICISDNDPYVWIGTRGGINLYDKRSCRIFPFPDDELRDKNIAGITVDRNGLTWIATGGMVYKCTKNTEIVKAYSISDSLKLTGFSINSIYVDKNNDLWVMAYGCGPLKYDASTDSFIAYPRIGNGNVGFIMYQDRADNYWIGTWGEGLWQFFPEKEGAACYKRHHILNARTGESDPIIFSMTQDDTFGYLWLLSYNELYALRLTPEGTLEQVDIHNLLDTHMMYTRIFKDRDGNLWLSSYDMAYTIFFDNSKIDNYPLPQLKERLGWDANLMSLCLDEKGVVWFSQDRYSLCLYDMATDKLAYGKIQNYPDLFETLVMIRSTSKGGVWANERGSSRIVRLVQQDLKISMEEDIHLNSFIPNPGEVRRLYEDRQGNLWIQTDTHILIKPAGLQTIIEAGDRDLPPTWDSSARHSCIDKEGCLWTISSLGKISRSGPTKQTFQAVALENEIADSSVLSLLADRNYVWIVTNKRVIQYDVGTGTLRRYSTADANVSVNVFRNKAVCLDGEGGLYAGGHGGFLHIRPGAAALPAGNRYEAVVTDVRVENRSLFFSGEDGRRANTVDHVYLEPGDRNIEIFFSSLTYSLTPQARIAYMLEGVDTDWVYPDDSKQSAFYNQLGKGTYRFRLKSEYEHGKWMEGTVKLTIEKAPAFYETWYAYCAYALLAGLCIYLILRFYLQRIQRKNRIKFREELNRTKLDYFTNVSHELLTPLTVLSTAVDNMERKTPSGRKQSAILKSNVDRLKRLIQQILDFRKMDMGRMTLNVSYGNIKDFINHICQTSFIPLAQKKGIDLHLDLGKDDLCGYVDFEILDKILYNLLSNAIKYTPEHKRIEVGAQPDHSKEFDALII